MKSTRLFLCLDETSNNWREVDLFDDISISLTYSVSEIQDITKTRGTYSGTITLPNTPRNAAVFDCLHEIARWGSTFEMLKSYPAFVECDGVRTMDGTFKLMQVTIDNDNDITYEGSLVDNVIQLANKLGTTTLRGNDDAADDLSFIDYKLSLTESNMLALFKMKKQWGSCLIDKTDKYKQPLFQFPTSGGGLMRRDPWYWDELTPYLRVKDIIDRIFQWAGFNYVSDFINGSDADFDFTKLIYPFSKHNSHLVMGTHTSVISQSIASDQVSMEIRLTSQDPSWGVSFGNNYTLTETDSMQQCSRWGLVPLLGGRYSLKFNFVAVLQVHFINLYGTSQTGTITQDTNYTDTSCSFSFRIVDTTDTRVIKSFTEEFEYSDEYYLDANGYADLAELEIDESFSLFSDGTVSYYMNSKSVLPYAAINNYRPFLNSNNNYVYPDKYRIVFKAKNVGDEVVTVERTSDWYLNGDFDPTTILNPKTKKLDLLTSIFKKFNLYAEDVSGKPDGNGGWYDPKTIRIEPRDTFYDTARHDWNNIIDKESISFERVDSYVDKVLTVKDKSDEDYWIKTYNDIHKLEYGEVNLRGKLCTNTDNEDTIETILGQTMCGPQNKATLLVEMPKMVTFSDGAVDIKKEYSDRIFFINLIDSETPPNNAPTANETITMCYRTMIPTTDEDAELEPIATFQQLRTRSNSYAYETHIFPIADNFNAPYGEDTADLNFGEAMWHYQYRMTGWFTGNTAFNYFYKQMVDEISSPESRLLTCKVFLSAMEMSLIKLSDIIIYDNQLWRINKIEGWNNTNTTTKVELLKVVDMPSTFATVGRTRSISLQRGALVSEVEQVATVAAETATMAEKQAKTNAETIKALTARIESLENLIKSLV